MSFAVIESRAGFNSAGTEPLAALEVAFGLVGAVVHASEKLRITADETNAQIRFIIFDSPSIPLLDLVQVFSKPKHEDKSNSAHLSAGCVNFHSGKLTRVWGMGWPCRNAIIGSKWQGSRGKRAEALPLDVEVLVADYEEMTRIL